MINCFLSILLIIILIGYNKNYNKITVYNDKNIRNVVYINQYILYF